jgi:hypothetical protein
MSFSPEQLVPVKNTSCRVPDLPSHSLHLSAWVPVLPDPAETFPRILVVQGNCVKILRTIRLPSSWTVAILRRYCRERPVPGRRMNRTKTMNTTERRAINWKSMRTKVERQTLTPTALEKALVRTVWSQESNSPGPNAIEIFCFSVPYSFQLSTAHLQL